MQLFYYMTYYPLSILDQCYYYSHNAIHTTSISKHILYILSNKYTQFLSHQLVYTFALYRYGYSSATVFFLICCCLSLFIGFILPVDSWGFILLSGISLALYVALRCMQFFIIRACEACLNRTFQKWRATTYTFVGCRWCQIVGCACFTTQDWYANRSKNSRCSNRTSRDVGLQKQCAVNGFWHNQFKHWGHNSSMCEHPGTAE